MSDSTDDYSWLTDLFGGGDSGGTATIDPAPSPGPSNDYGTPGPGSPLGMVQSIDANGNVVWTDPATGQQYASDGTPIGANAPGSGANSPSANDPTGGSSSSSPASLSSLLSALGLKSSDLPGILGALAALGGGLYASNQTNKATGQVVSGLQNAGQQISSILGPGAGQGSSPGIFAPYMNAGTQALGKLGNFNYQPLAPQFGNLSTQGVNALPSKLTLGQMTGGK